MLLQFKRNDLNWVELTKLKQIKHQYLRVNTNFDVKFKCVLRKYGQEAHPFRALSITS